MEPDASTLANGSRFQDRYEILEEPGRGSFGRVYRARQPSTGQSVARLLDAVAVRAFDTPPRSSAWG